MNLQQVRYFLALCAELNFGRAAKRCNVTQPSLTNGIKNLEWEFGGQLFKRDRSGTRMAALGSLVKPYLQRVQHNCELAHDKASNFVAAPRSQGQQRSLLSRASFSASRRFDQERTI